MESVDCILSIETWSKLYDLSYSVLTLASFDLSSVFVLSTAIPLPDW